MSEPPKISVLVPVYKVEPYIEECLDSLLSQTSTDFEIIAVDDSSPDRSGEMTLRILEQQSRIRWKFIKNAENKGLAETRRIAALAASGEYVLCVDSDDHVHHDLIRRVAEEAEKLNADIVIFAAENISPDGKINYRVEAGDTVMSGVEAVEKILDLTLQAYCFNKLVRRSIFLAIEHPTGLIYEDICVSVQTLGKASVVRLMPDTLYSYMYRESGISTRFNPKIIDIFAIMDRVEKSTASMPIRNYRKLFFRLKYVYGFRTIAFQAAIKAPTYRSAEPILDSVAQRLRLRHLLGMVSDHRPKLSLVMAMLKIHPWIFYRFVRRFGH
ncbi:MULTISPECIES: glycosyltransferase family 2 protein [Caballeronia]|jgi:glycosyltransferase involved in cell wall biosynthesis|uniref:Glycosyl transferase family 2 n=1 Tax=Caballeronia zhejiangensis TaxID=871203 RepID=A0A656QV08_9BURK|nr:MULTISPECIES: glycosyltransferase family 2 protein [Caballeronia]EKS70960.1 glycosyl transferase family protein [Burkholderia sp. SJ98]KDR33987.1 glycosyl transferase family 2 [Caballeronia zhejiangensis]MCG7404703.1 glycosyltransferase [Caballeronia zhejiangensis]MCI1044129.1 glycosyltransferase family 2 protein [Caballeronia zhejiangensis]MDR5769830.1 glycosyltransferase family 2 protein [Caballeronia sp. LZ028]